MARREDVFPSSYYKASDIPPDGLVVKIVEVVTETMPDGTKKRCLKFEEGVKRLTLNRVNWTSCSEITGKDDDSDWPGHRIRLMKERVSFRGDLVDAIRVKTPDIPF